MDRDHVDFYCPQCGYKKTELFYAPDFNDFRAGDCQSANSSRERSALNGTCPECGHKGFVRKHEYLASPDDGMDE